MVDIAKAREALSRLADGRKVRMRVPAHADDDDRLLDAALDELESLRAVEAAAGRLAGAWARLCDCTDEFLPDYAGACDEIEQELYAAVERLLAAARQGKADPA